MNTKKAPQIRDDPRKLRSQKLLPAPERIATASNKEQTFNLHEIEDFDAKRALLSFSLLKLDYIFQ